MAVDIWWHDGPAIGWWDGRMVDMPVLNEPEYGYSRVELDGDNLTAAPPRAEAIIAYADADETCRYHVVPVGSQPPDWPGKRLLAHCREPIHVPGGYHILFSPE